jgi:hypothetical protein
VLLAQLTTLRNLNLANNLLEDIPIALVAHTLLSILDLQVRATSNIAPQKTFDLIRFDFHCQTSPSGCQPIGLVLVSRPSQDSHAKPSVKLSVKSDAEIAPRFLIYF